MKKHLKRTWFIYTYIVVYILKWIGIIDYVPSFVTGVFLFLLIYYFLIQPINDESVINSTAILILKNALIRKGLISETDLFISQNDLVGRAYSGYIENLEKLLLRNGLFLEAYRDDDEIKLLLSNKKNLNYSIFRYMQSFSNNSSSQFIDETKIRKLE